MQSKTSLLILYGLLSATIGNAACLPGSDGGSRKAFDAGEVSPEHVVPFARLLARPEAFNGKRVLVYGVLAQDGSGFSLYADSEAMKFSILPSAVFLDLTDSLKLISCRSNRRYVLVQGTFEFQVSGPQERIVRRTGTLKNITRLAPLQSRDLKW
jgi:hypothetical protein